MADLLIGSSGQQSVENGNGGDHWYPLCILVIGAN
jgi:hypothetical protein